MFSKLPPRRASQSNYFIRNTSRCTRLNRSQDSSAKHDVFITAHWIPGGTNCLADALSRQNIEQIANLCPHWQSPYRFTNFLPTSKPLLPPLRTSGQSFSGTA